MKKILVISSLMMSVVLFSCGGGNSNSASNNGETSKSGNKSTAPDEDVKTAGIDINASSDSKGVGQFTNVQVGESIDPEMAAKGKEIFQTKCTVCHQATDQKLIGPGLKGITKIRTPEWIMNMITNPDEMVQQDAVAKAVYEEFNHTQMTNQGVDKEGARDLYEFLRQNDAE